VPTPDQIRKRLEFYRDLGIESIYRRRGSGPPAAEVAASARPPAAELDVAPVPSESWNASEVNSPPVNSPPQVEAVAAATGEIVLPGLAPEGDTLATIRGDIGDCRRCRLCEGRKTIVFGSGNEGARLVFVGEGPGADEDEQGLPFVGRAGQLLTQMIDNTAKKEGIPVSRQDVYICNVVKCRPPENRTPLPDEMEICGQFLYRQLMTLKPKAICALGGTATKALLNSKLGITKLRGEWQKWNDIPVMVTYHPSYLLRQYNQQAKREAWEDLKRVLHFVYD
jgi:uracil-DNA glycosylase